MYVEEELTTIQIGEQYRVSASTINKWLRECEIPIRNYKPSDNPEQLENLLEGYVNE